jgi:hypothetical protein
MGGVASGCISIRPPMAPTDGGQIHERSQRLLWHSCARNAPTRTFGGWQRGAGALVSVGPRAAANGAGDDVEILRLGAEWLPLQRRSCALMEQVADMVHIPDMNSSRKLPIFAQPAWKL